MWLQILDGCLNSRLGKFVGCTPQGKVWRY